MAAWLLSLLLMGATYTTAFRAYMDEIDMPNAPPEFVRKRVATTWQENSAPAFSSVKEEHESWAEFDSPKRDLQDALLDLYSYHDKTINHLDPGYGSNVLHEAAIMGMKDEVAVLLEIGADPNVLTIQGSLSGPRAHFPGSNALILASENGHTEIVSLLLAAGAAVDVQNKEHGNTALFLAATKGYTRIVQLLLAAKAGIEIRGESGQDTPLTRASFEGHADVVELLLEAGANVSAPTTRASQDGLWTGGNALVQAVKGYDVRRGEDVQYLGEDSTSQLEARIVAMLLDAGADSTARDRFGSTPLIVAAASGSVLVVKELLRHRSAAELSINVSTYWEDNTAIGYAAFNGFVEIARVLLDAGADPSVKNRKGLDAMDLARTPTPHMRSERYKDLTARRKRIVQMLRAHTSKLPPSGSGRVGSPANHEGQTRHVIQRAEMGGEGPKLEELYKQLVWLFLGLVALLLGLGALCGYGFRALCTGGSFGWVAVGATAVLVLAFIAGYLRLLSAAAIIVCSASCIFRRHAAHNQNPRALIWALYRDIYRDTVACGVWLAAEGRFWLRVLRWNTNEDGAVAFLPEHRGRRRRGRDRARTREGPTAQREESGTVPSPDAPAVKCGAGEPQWWLDLDRFYADLEAAARVEKPDYMCSITNEIMRNPAALVDGDVFQHVYEYDAIALWMTDNCIDPRSGVSIDPTRCALIRDKRLEREIRSWCEDKALSWRIQLDSGSEAPVPRRSLHVFVDHSNVAVGAARLGKQLDVMHLVRHVEGLRDVKERVVIGSHEAERARHEWERHGYSVSADSRHGPERFVDDALHAQLMRTAAKAFDPPRVIALVTGDGNRNDGRTNFPECVEEALRQRWHVELYSWRQQTSNVYVVLAEQYAGHFCICYLDDICGMA